MSIVMDRKRKYRNGTVVQPLTDAGHVRGPNEYASDGRNEAEQREKSEVSTNKSQEVKMI